MHPCPPPPPPSLEEQWQRQLLLRTPGDLKTAPLCGAVGHSAAAACVHSALKGTAVRILRCVGATTRHRWRGRTDGTTRRLWGIFVSGETCIDAAKGQKSSGPLPIPLRRALLKNPFFLVRTALEDIPWEPPTANR